jgi:hypothetical protein
MPYDGSYTFDRPETGTTAVRWALTVVVVLDAFAFEDDEPHAARNRATAQDATAIRRLERAVME